MNTSNDAERKETEEQVETLKEYTSLLERVRDLRDDGVLPTDDDMKTLREYVALLQEKERLES